MSNKIGLHLLHNPSYERIIPLIQKLKPQVIKALVLAGSGSYLAGLADALKGSLDYEPTFVMRLWWDDANAGDPTSFSTLRNRATLHQAGQSHYSPNIAYNAWRAAVRPSLEAVQFRDNFYVESFNEVGIEKTYLQFERERTVLLREDYGLRSLTVNMAVGWSTLAHFEMMREVGLIETMRQHGGAFGEHAYGSVLGMALWHGPLNQAAKADGTLERTPAEIAGDRNIYLDTVDSWLAFRPSMSHQHLTKTGGGDVPIIISEFGIDDAGYNSYRHHTGGAGAGAWRECIPFWKQLGFVNDQKSPEQFYGEQLAYAEMQMSIYPWLIGATVFTVGSDPASRWALYDVLDTPVFDHFLATLETPAPEPEPEPEPEPIPDLPDDGRCLVQALQSRVNIRAEANATSEIVGILEPGEIRESLGFVEEAPGRLWFKIEGGYVAGWVVRTSAYCSLIVPDPDPDPPIAVITGPSLARVGQERVFHAGNSQGDIIDWSWAFGDGLAAIGQTVTHTYRAAGGYNVLLTVMDANGLTHTASHEINVSAADTPPPNDPTPPSENVSVALELSRLRIKRAAYQAAINQIDVEIAELS